jgi:hypothetical protein
MSSWETKTVMLKPVDGRMATLLLPALRVEDRRFHDDHDKPSYVTHAYCPCCQTRFLFITSESQIITAPDDALCLGCLQAVSTRALRLNEHYVYGDAIWAEALREEQKLLGTLPKQRCGNPLCGTSSGTDDSLTFGSGDLDPNGFWEHPCLVCAMAHLSQFPMDRVWPRDQAMVNRVEALNKEERADCYGCQEYGPLCPKHGTRDDNWCDDPNLGDQ